MLPCKKIYINCRFYANSIFKNKTIEILDSKIFENLPIKHKSENIQSLNLQTLILYEYCHSKKLWTLNLGICKQEINFHQTFKIALHFFASTHQNLCCTSWSQKNHHHVHNVVAASNKLMPMAEKLVEEFQELKSSQFILINARSVSKISQFFIMPQITIISK